MPLAISMAIAFSFDKLTSAGVLIVRPEALETSGSLMDICTSKSNTLTLAKPSVRKLSIGTDNSFQEVVDGSFNEELKSFLADLIIMNTQAFLETDDKKHKYIAVGAPIETALLNFLSDNNRVVQDLFVKREREQKLMASAPFSSARMCMTVAYLISEINNDNEKVEKVRVVVKGAPEIIVKNCISAKDMNNETVAFDEHREYLENVVSRGIAREGLKPLTIAYKDIDKQRFEELQNEHGNFESPESRAVLESNLVLVASFGFYDQFRSSVNNTILQLAEANTNTRILSGDHKDVVIHMMNQLEMPTTHDEDNEDSYQAVFSGEEIRQRMDGMFAVKLVDDCKVIEFESSEMQTKFKQLRKQVRAVYRCTPDVKELFLAGLSQLTTCAVTGHLAGDVPAIKQASVGFTLGKCGCDLARASGDVIILDDDFNSVYNAVQWGRNLFDNCRKFIQFQLTVNISCIWIVLLGGISLGQSPFSVLELLWINLIMDVLAAIALSSEAPLPGELRKERVNLKKDALVTPIMWRQIYSQTLYQVLVMTTLLYAAPAMFGIKYNLVTGVAASDPTAAY